jgi:hypothetical protein
MSEEFTKVESLFDKFKAYGSTRLSQAKLSVAEKGSKLGASLITMLVMALVLFLFLVLVSAAAAIAIGQWLDSLWLGFIIVAGLVLLLGLILYMARDRLLRIPIMNRLIEALFEKEDDEED